MSELDEAAGKALEAGKKFLGDRWESFTAQEKKEFTNAVVLMGKARLAELAGDPSAAEDIRILNVVMGEWKLAGATEMLMATRHVAETVITIGVPILRKAILGF